MRRRWSRTTSVGGYGKPPYETGFTAEQAETTETYLETSAPSVLSAVRTLLASVGHTCPVRITEGALNRRARLIDRGASLAYNADKRRAPALAFTHHHSFAARPPWDSGQTEEFL